MVNRIPGHVDGRDVVAVCYHRLRYCTLQLAKKLTEPCELGTVLATTLYSASVFDLDTVLCHF
jgi:hypothetical protein